MSDMQGVQQVTDLATVRQMLGALLPGLFDESASVWVARAIEDLKAAEAIILARDRMVL